jgi:N-methylhydantoinase A/oxoprolinase/acetone carboxylase beta subunit
MSILLGIDTGGTYTDAAVFDDARGVISSAKALTTKHDLSIGIRNAIAGALPEPVPDIRLVSISTTLATNAIVEGQGSSIALLLIGYPPDALDLAGLRQALGGDPVAMIGGGHNAYGEEQAPLDLEAARAAILEHAHRSAAFAISGYFGVRNPAHELAVRDLARELTGAPATCGHELTQNLNAPRRALTVALNARLISLLQQLVLAVRATLDEHGIRAPLMVVKGDGSLVDASVALQRPVETILSGPAASVVGAHYLSGERDVFVVDMGGTTSDVALLRDGRPVLNKTGARVGGWRTMVEAVAVHTFGLGGDSEVRLDQRDELVVGPRRVIPLSLLAHQRPEVIDILRQQLARPALDGAAGQFAVPQRAPSANREALTPQQAGIWQAISTGPIAVTDLLANAREAYFRKRDLIYLVERGLVVLSGFTPTDAAHVLGYQADWSLEAARLGADLWARRVQAAGQAYGHTGPSFCQQVMQQVTVQAGRALVTVALDEMAPDLRLGGRSGLTAPANLSLEGHEELRRLFVDASMGEGIPDGALLDVALSLRRPIVAIGAPVPTYFPLVARRLRTRLCIPEHAGIANAVGAVVGGVMQTVRAIIRPMEAEANFRIHLPNGVHDYPNLADAAAFALLEVARLAEAQAVEAGAAEVQVQSRRDDHIVRIKRDDDVYEEVFMECEVIATAVGRPRLGT